MKKRRKNIEIGSWLDGDEKNRDQTSKPPSDFFFKKKSLPDDDDDLSRPAQTHSIPFHPTYCLFFFSMMETENVYIDSFIRSMFSFSFLAPIPIVDTS